MLVNKCIFYLISINILNVLGYVPKLIVLSFDGFRSDYLHPKLTPTMFKLANDGVHTNKMKSMYATKTFPNHFSIVTGLYEENHGITGNYLYDPVFNATFNFPNLEEKWWDDKKVNPIWNLNQMYNEERNTGVIMWPGSPVKYGGKTPKYLVNYDHNMPNNQKVDILIEWMTKPEPANLVFAYFNEPDSTIHDFGPFSPETKNEILNTENTVKYLLEKLTTAKLIHETNIIIVSDHGMAETNENTINVLNDYLDDEDDIEIYGSSPVLNLLVKDKEKIDSIYLKLLNKAKNNHFIIYKRSNVPKEYHYSNHRRILDIIVEAEEGFEMFYNEKNQTYVYPKKDYSLIAADLMPNNTKDDIIEKFKNFLERKKKNNLKYFGNHGYNNSLYSMKPLFLANGPAFKKNYLHNQTFENIDLYYVMCNVLNLFVENSTMKNNYCIQDGNPLRVKDMLEKVTYLNLDESKGLNPFVDFLCFGFAGFSLLVLCGYFIPLCLTFANRKKKKKYLLKIDLNDDIVDIDLSDHLLFKNRLKKKKNYLEDEFYLLNNQVDENFNF